MAVVVDILKEVPLPAPNFRDTFWGNLQFGALANTLPGSFQLEHPNPLFGPIEFNGSALTYGPGDVTGGIIKTIEIYNVGDDAIARIELEKASAAAGLYDAVQAYQGGNQAALDPYFKVPTVYNGSPGDDVIIDWGTKGTLKGKNGDDFLNGVDGNDKIDGGGGDDEIRGDVGKDNINAGGGKDLINGGANKDKIKTGGGKDVVIIDQFGAANADTVQDWSKKDKFQLDPAVFDMLDGLATFPKEFLVKGKAKEDDDYFVVKGRKLFVDFDANGPDAPELLVKVSEGAILAASILIG
jgi:hypothetical protein